MLVVLMWLLKQNLATAPRFPLRRRAEGAMITWGGWWWGRAAVLKKAKDNTLTL
jgi:hypothetical protein